MNLNQCLLTGCPGSGKTTLIEFLQHQGLTCVDEPARKIIAEQRAMGGEGIPDRNTKVFTDLLLSTSIQSFRQHLGSARSVIYDRGLPDVNGYATLFGIDTANFYVVANENLYNKSAFLAPPWEEIYATDDERKMTFPRLSGSGDRNLWSVSASKPDQDAQGACQNPQARLICLRPGGITFLYGIAPRTTSPTTSNVLPARVWRWHLRECARLGLATARVRFVRARSPVSDRTSASY